LPAESIRIDSEPAGKDQFEQFVENLLPVTEIHQLQDQKLAKGERINAIKAVDLALQNKN
jgi:hypothetical protein